MHMYIHVQQVTMSPSCSAVGNATHQLVGIPERLLTRLIYHASLWAGEIDASLLGAHSGEDPDAIYMPSSVCCRLQRCELRVKADKYNLHFGRSCNEVDSAFILLLTLHHAYRSVPYIHTIIHELRGAASHYYSMEVSKSEGVLSLPPPSITSSSSRPLPSTNLTTFPNPFEDEPEPGLLPTLFSKVKNTFVSSTSTTQNPGAKTTKTDKGPAAPVPASNDAPRQVSLPTLGTQQTEAQAIAEAERRKAARRQSAGPSPTGLSPVPPTLSIPEEGGSSSRLSPTTGAGSRSLRPPSTNHSTGSSSSVPSAAPSFIRSRRLVPPGERQWRPSGAAPAQVTISPVTSVTTTIQATKSTPLSLSTDDTFSPPPPRVAHRAHFAPPPPSAALRSSANPATRLRRSSIATLPDSPSSISLSAMIAANAELSQNTSYVPGFPLPQDDTRSVRSLGFVKKSNSVSRLIRRMRGEGLSKHYWMADEHCKECYDCKSVCDGSGIGQVA